MNRDVTPSAQRAIEQQLGLAEFRDHDWELVLANPERLEEFCGFYQGSPLSDDERYALMRLILSSWEARKREQPQRPGDELVLALLRRDFALHEETIRYWALEDGRPEDEEVFSITPAMRTLIWAMRS